MHHAVFDTWKTVFNRAVCIFRYLMGGAKRHVAFYINLYINIKFRTELSGAKVIYFQYSVDIQYGLAILLSCRLIEGFVRHFFRGVQKNFYSGLYNKNTDHDTCQTV